MRQRKDKQRTRQRMDTKVREMPKENSRGKTRVWIPWTAGRAC
jgi:hypothetical protein